MDKCELCPRRCRVDRKTEYGYCGCPGDPVVSLVSRHRFEEPCISGTRGSGTVFFSGCNLRCVFCQNAPVSREIRGDSLDAGRLSEIFFKLQESGVHNINLVTPTHYSDTLRDALQIFRKGGGTLPVVWNSGGYELPQTLEMFDGLIDIYMPDFKYRSPGLSAKYSSAPDYAVYAAACLKAMAEVLGAPRFSEDGMLLRGVLVRHLVLPGCRADSAEVLRTIADTVPTGDILLSLMSQYSPGFYSGEERNLRRRLTGFEYDRVLAEARRLGFRGFMQSRTSSGSDCTPEFTDRLRIEL